MTNFLFIFTGPPEHMNLLMETYKKEFGNPNIKFYPHVHVTFEAMHRGATDFNK